MSKAPVGGGSIVGSFTVRSRTFNWIFSGHSWGHGTMRKLSNEREASLLIIHHIIWTQKTLVFLILCWPVCVYIQCAISSLETDCRPFNRLHRWHSWPSSWPSWPKWPRWNRCLKRPKWQDSDNQSPRSPRCPDDSKLRRRLTVWYIFTFDFALPNMTLSGNL